jgi:predicted DNA-binding protein YlxM (UPF0122 family)
MSKLSVAEAAEQFKVSKEAIHNRIRRGSLDCVIEHGVKYVLIDEPATAAKVPENDKYYSYIEDENRALKDKVIELETQNLTLRDQKEKMLIEEKKKIEQIYKERDEQLKQVLHTISSKFLPHVEQTLVEETAEDVVDVEEVSDNKEAYSEPIRLKRFLKLKAYKPAKRQRVKNRFKRLVGRDERVVRRDGKIFVDPVKYDYQDLLD